ncbi:MAG: S8 family serine peptidase [Planctomycetales bacterium]|nr:S8 family serine peptidase [Planctomycetales bacterium]
MRRKRQLALEQLESRFALAADIACSDLESLELPTPESAWEGDVLVQATDPGRTIATAFDLGLLSGTQSFADTITRRDRDLLRFELANAQQGSQTVLLQLDQLTADLDLYIYDSNGARIAESRNANAAAEELSLSLAAGEYFVLISPYRRAVSDYRLTLSTTGSTTPTAPPTDPDTNPDAPTNPADPPSDPPANDSPTEFPAVAYYGGANEWNLNAINAPEVWAQGYTGQGVTVAVVDTGVDLEHSDLVSNLWVNAGEIAGNGIDDDHNGYVDDVHGWDFANGDNRPDDTNGHGTHVAGTIAAAANGFGATGVAPGATVMPVQVLGSDGSGSSLSVAEGIRYAARNGADIINLSLGGGYSSQILAAIRYAEQLGVVVIAAAGNESSGVPGYPARFSASLTNVISVGAHDSRNTLANFSNRVGGSGAVQVDAPGVGVYSTFSGNRYGRLSGTSMATPHVAGVAALVLSANSSLSPSSVRSLIVAGADRAIGRSDSAGGVNAATSVAAALTSTTSGAASANATASGGGPTSRTASRMFGTIAAGMVSPVTDLSESDDEMTEDRHLASTKSPADRHFTQLPGQIASRTTEPATAQASRSHSQLAFGEWLNHWLALEQWLAESAAS